MLRVTVTLNELSSKIAKVSGASEGGDQNLQLSQTKIFDIPEGGTLTITESDVLADLTIRQQDGEPLTDISEGNHNNPNGIQSAGVAPKLPKAGGETMQVSEGGRIVERSVSDDPAKAVQGGGPDSVDGRTPGPDVGAAVAALPVGAPVDATAEDGGAARNVAAGVPAPTQAQPQETKGTEPAKPSGTPGNRPTSATSGGKPSGAVGTTETAKKK